jgi:hypothetical protein
MDKRDAKLTIPGHHRDPHRPRTGPGPEEKALNGFSEILDRYVAGIKKRCSGQGRRKLQRLLDLKRTYPEQSFFAALSQALDYGMYDLSRLEAMILQRVAGDFFNIEDPS